MKRIEQKVIKFIDSKKLIDKGDRILVGLSGGPDSVFLLNLLAKYKKRFGIELFALHVNHGLRGKKAAEDEKFCYFFCKKLEVEFFAVRKHVKSYSLKHKVSIEEAGREVRYNQLSVFAKKLNCTKIATAHNSDDNAETVLLNLIKGTGLRGISGIPFIRGNIIRPVLGLKKEEILDYLEFFGIEFMTDESNYSNEYERNFLRNEIIPLIKERLNPSLEETILKSSEIFRKDYSIIKMITENSLQNCCKFSKNELRIKIESLGKLESGLKAELIKTALERNFSVQFSFNDVEKLIDLSIKDAGSKVELSNNLIGVNERVDILIRLNSAVKKFKARELKIGEKTQINGKSLFLKIKNSPIEYSADKLKEYVSGDNLVNNFIVRRWKSGDRFYPLGLKGSKKISDFLNEQKISPSHKKEQLVLTNNNEIVWVIGLRIDERFKVTSKTKKVYELCLK